ncbi:inhibitor of apoptosis-promoting Bax1 protein [Medicago truncatula]|uniref:Inhibitor of apoptosis-promoting Bax1 protein n=1 Tax=Medicago truncatula TaxID=3880 RepID=A0A072U3U7_MEDTR|nr:inhibitor of apoptosis-promoting Bax1 protein [Medicago truncatula]
MVAHLHLAGKRQPQNLPQAGKVILVSVISTTAVVFSLTLYTFWAARRGHDFSFLGPFLYGSLLILVLFGLIQVLFPLDKLSHISMGVLELLYFLATLCL